MHNFSVKQRLHLFMVPLYALARLIMDQWMLKFVPLSFSSQMYFESVKKLSFSNFIGTHFTIIRFKPPSLYHLHVYFI